ncbi:cell envelope integrity inner membrane protein [Diplodia corticola]|uniref:Cell envelope integrity inner membrane protein n=1 Tax=Diplodia corticola TaxID=236234 RepID=A0A1J9QU26_9PEZI|nr:cell envelope integrity inner membrane protein [Diplodia corticola]OJD31905.1 cell envelope integrity inner membrane protein [Diplodia corticola]
MDFLSDLFARRNVMAESRPNVNEGIQTSQESGGGGTAQQRGHAGVKGGASTSTPTSRSGQNESGAEVEANRQDEKKGGTSGGGGGGSSSRESSGRPSGASGGSGGIEAKLRDCVSSNDVNPAKKQYSACVSNGKGDCTEELVNLAQRITQCAAPDKFGARK